MKIGVIGLGRMGANIARRLIRGGHEVVVHNRSPEPVQELAREGAIASTDFRDMRSRLGEKAIYWVMLPAGALTEETIDEIASIARPGDILIDGGNSYYKDDIRRAKALREKRLEYVDIGVSGGVWGLQRGYCMMIGGDAEVVRALEPIFETLAPGYGDIVRTTGRDAPDDRAEKGYIHAGSAGAGHFVKMVHNGIEYGLMQAYAEGFDILKNKDSQRLPEDERFTLYLPDIAEVWRRGSVIRSWLLDLMVRALETDPHLEDIDGYAEDSGEGRWTVNAAVDLAVPVPTIAASLFARFVSRQDDSPAMKMVAAMRNQFGGHAVTPAKD